MRYVILPVIFAGIYQMITEKPEVPMSSSGRGVISKKATVDEGRPIDILDLQRNGLFAKGPHIVWTCRWSRYDEVVASINYRLIYDASGHIGIRFYYTTTDQYTGDRENFDYTVNLTSTPCHFGGRRWWFVCPLVTNGHACHRRCRIIYLPPGARYLGCRECHQLTYESRQKHRNQYYEGLIEPFEQIERLERRLRRLKGNRFE